MNEVPDREPTDCQECGSLAEELDWLEDEEIWLCPYCEHAQAVTT